MVYGISYWDGQAYLHDVHRMSHQLPQFFERYCERSISKLRPRKSAQSPDHVCLGLSLTVRAQRVHSTLVWKAMPPPISSLHQSHHPSRSLYPLPATYSIFMPMSLIYSTIRNLIISWTAATTASAPPAPSRLKALLGAWSCIFSRAMVSLLIFLRIRTILQEEAMARLYEFGKFASWA